MIKQVRYFIPYGISDTNYPLHSLSISLSLTHTHTHTHTKKILYLLGVIENDLHPVKNISSVLIRHTFDKVTLKDGLINHAEYTSTIPTILKTDLIAFCFYNPMTKLKVLLSNPVEADIICVLCSTIIL